MEIKFDDSWAWVDMTVCKDRGSDTTLLVIGDSWAWGDEINGSCGLMSSPVSNTDQRVQYTVGSLLSDHLESNLVQFAMPSASWPWIISEYKKLIKQVSDQSQKVIAMLILPDLGRELDSGDVSLYKELFEEGNSISQTLQLIEEHYYQQIKNITEQYTNVYCIASPSFTRNINSLNNQLPVFWSGLLGITVNPIVHTSGSWAILQFLEKYKLINPTLKEEFSDILFPATLKSRNQMDASPLFYDRCHPTVKGHEIWANYLYFHLKNSLINQ